MTIREIEQLSFADLLLFGEQQDVRALMKPELRRIDELLDDEALVDEVMVVLRRRRPHSARRGRPATPAVVVLRMLVLKHLQGWSYEQLEWEVRGSLVHRHFCRIGAGRVPDAKTLVRLGQLLSGEVLERLLGRTVSQAVEHKVTRGRKLRIDTTVIDAPIRYPTDSGLCEDVVRVCRRQLQRLDAAGVTLPFKGPWKSLTAVCCASPRGSSAKQLRPSRRHDSSSDANAEHLAAPPPEPWLSLKRCCRSVVAWCSKRAPGCYMDRRGLATSW